MNRQLDRLVGVAAALTLASLCGCMNVQKIHQPPATLQENIRNGELVRPGDRIAVVTTSQGERILIVTEVNKDSIRGEGVVVPIDEVVALEKREISAGSTALAALGIYMLLPVVGLSFLILAGIF